MIGWWQTTADAWDPRLLAVVVVALLVSGSLTLWIRLGWRAVEGQAILPYEPRRPVPWTIVGLLLLAMVFFVALVTFSALYAELDVTKFFALEPDSPLETMRRVAPVAKNPDVLTSADVLILVVSQLTALLAALVGFRKWFGTTPEDWGLVTTHVWLDLGVAIIAAIAFLPPLYALQALLHQFNDTPHPLIRALTESNDPLLLPLALVTAGLWAPICEELFFRVIFQGWLERVLVHRHAMSPDDTAVQELAPDGEVADQYAPAIQSPRGGWLPIVISAAVFAFVHLDMRSPNFDFVPIFFFACGLGYLYQRTHRALPSILLHMILNVCSLTALMLTLPSR
jgi:membrane protease YdiL (CAAX protease family)